MSQRFERMLEQEAADEESIMTDALILETVVFALIGSIRPFGFNKARFRELLSEGAASLAQSDPEGSLADDLRITGDGVMKILARRALGGDPSEAMDERPTDP
ncbi:hypothetical protein [Methylobacterium trifolii]|uniref:Uncharacterized protein n=1 Tax=Methylobacterium trifolii TaxID=1003092 RepID=A0ABQ4TVQ9_9HYPH|nr:hypothetical protein [Methylobacterium trifolii]GJE58057.1 hypothetical protein MPOCJGCO_0135 [Methylobacterium trifolii]